MPISPDYQPIDFQSLATEQERVDRALEIAKIWNAKTRALVALGAAPDLNEIKGSFEVIESVREQIMDLKLSGLASGDAIEPRINLLVNARIDALIKVLLANGESYASVHQELRKISGGDPTLTADYLLRLDRNADDLGIPKTLTRGTATPTPTPTPTPAPAGGGAPRPAAGAGGAGTPPPAGHTPTGAAAGTPPPAGGGPPGTPGSRMAYWRDQIDQIKRMHTASGKLNSAAANRDFEELKKELDNRDNESILSSADKIQLKREMFAGEIKKNPEDMDQLERIAELRSLRTDPFINYSKEAKDDRANRIASDFLAHMGDYQKETDPNRKLEIFSEQVTYVLDLVNTKLDQGKNFGTRPREKLFEVLDTYNLTRNDLLIATTYHPRWGNAVREFIDTAIKEASYEKLPAGSPLKPASKIMLNPDPALGIHNREEFSYNLLTSSNGTKYLAAYFEQRMTKPPGMSDPDFKKTKEVAKSLFEVFDMADIVLAQGQRAANGTRNHNNTETMDPIFSTDPIASFVQNWDRYGANLADWRGWFLAMVEDIPSDEYAYEINHDTHKKEKKLVGGKPLVTRRNPADQHLYGAAGEADKMRDFQKLVRLFLDSYFPIDILRDERGNLPKLAKFGESYFPDARDLLKLGEAIPGAGQKEPERLSVLGIKTVEGPNGTSRGTADAREIKNWDQYEIAMTGWKAMLDYTFKSIGTNLTEEQVLESYGSGKKGLLNDFFSAASKAKTFSPKHLEAFFGPMLTLFCARIIQNFKGEAWERKELLERIIAEIKTTYSSDRALKDFKGIMDHVIKQLQTPGVCELGPIARQAQNQKYIEALWDYHERARSKTVWMPRIRNPQKINEEAEEYRKLKRHAPGDYPKSPARREGSMVDAEQEKRTH